MNFDWRDFLIPLDGSVLVMAAALGFALGWASGRPTYSPGQHLYWRIVTGFVFFIPLSAIRAMQGSDTWERFLAGFPLWVVFTIAMTVATITMGRLTRPQ